MPNIVQVTLTMFYYGQVCQNRLHFEDRSGGPMEMPAIAQEIRDNWVSQIRIPLTNDVTFSSIRVRRLGDVQTDFTLNLLNTFGAQAQETQNIPFAAWVLRYQTGFAGHKFRGRSYLPGYRHGDQQFGQLNQGGSLIWLAPLAALNARFSSAGAGPLLLVVHGDGPNPHDTPVSVINLRTTLGSMRKRNIGVGI